MERRSIMLDIQAVAVLDDGEEEDFWFEINENATDRKIVNKAFEIAYCKHFNLEKVYIVSFGD